MFEFIQPNIVSEINFRFELTKVLSSRRFKIQDDKDKKKFV
jgi:hypothetical protein